MPKVMLVIVLVGSAVAAQPERELDQLVSRYSAFGFRGTVLVAKKGKPILEKGFGVADPRSGRPNDARTLFEIASITKQITAAAIMLLEQDGKLKVEDSIADHLPGVLSHSRKITIHHLLTHTSGVPGGNTDGRGDDLERAVVAYLGDGPQRALGDKWEYWNGGYALLAGIVERVGEMTFMEYCRKRLFTPAGMKSTGFTGSGKLDKGRAAFNERRSAIDHPYGSYGWQYRGMGGVVTTVGDLLKWDRALSGDAVLGADARNKLFQPHATARYRRNYGYGWFVGRAPDGSAMAQHGGGVRGFRSDFRRYPKLGGCIAILSNGDGSALPYIAENLECVLFGNKPRHTLPPQTIMMSPKKLKPFVGTYRTGSGDAVVVAPAASGLQVEVRGPLAAKLSGDSRTVEASFLVMPAGNNRFTAWSWRRTLPLEFVRKGEKVSALKVIGLRLTR